MLNKKGLTISMTYALLTSASIWTPGQNNPGVDLCLEGVKD